MVPICSECPFLDTKTGVALVVAGERRPAALAPHRGNHRRYVRKSPAAFVALRMMLQVRPDFAPEMRCMPDLSCSNRCCLTGSARRVHDRGALAPENRHQRAAIMAS